MLWIHNLWFRLTIPNYSLNKPLLKQVDFNTFLISSCPASFQIYLEHPKNPLFHILFQRHRSSFDLFFPPFQSFGRVCRKQEQIDIIFLYYFKNQDSMTNPFQALDIAYDDDETFTPAVEQKVKRTHHEKRLYKQQQEAAKVAATTQPVVTEPLPTRIKEDAKQIRNNRAPPTPQSKKLGEGHYLDRRSGTGRVDKPRKEGGGWGNVGNVKDELNKDKYIKQTPEETQAQTETATDAPAEQPAEQKVEEPEALTLEEYYKSKGVEINNTFEKKAPVKKAEINAEWIKKEKLTVLESKEDKKISERNKQNVVKQTSAKVGLDENLEGLGFFGQKTAPKQEQRRDHKNDYKGKGKKVVINESDFPSL